MGRTLLPFRPALDQEIATWRRFKQGLKSEDQLIFDQLMGYARQHGDAGSLAARFLLSEVIFLSIGIEQNNQIHQMQDQIDTLSKQLESICKKS